MSHSAFTLSADEIDDLIYFSRAGDLESLKESITDLSKTYSCSPQAILAATIDLDEDGNGSGSCLLHYPSANGNLEIVSYLLSLLDFESTAATSTESGQTTKSNVSTSALVNHQNMSGNTALHWAGMNGHLQVVQALVKAGADPEIVNGAGRDAVVESEWSSKEGATECAVWILKECGALEKGVGENGGEDESSTRIVEEADDLNNHEDHDDKDNA